jgi:hypothetical protein
MGSQNNDPRLMEVEISAYALRIVIHQGRNSTESLMPRVHLQKMLKTALSKKNGLLALSLRSMPTFELPQ